MTVVEKKPIPIYETECQECHTRYRYRSVEVMYMHTNCPVCGVSNWASLTPVAYDNGEGENDEIDS